MDGAVVTVSAEEGVFPADAVLSVVSVPASQTEEAIEEERGEALNVAVSYTFDIRVLDADGTECQPADDQLVKVSFTLDQVGDTNLDATIYLIEDGCAEALQTVYEDGQVFAETDGFSYEETGDISYPSFLWISQQ